MPKSREYIEFICPRCGEKFTRRYDYVKYMTGYCTKCSAIIKYENPELRKKIAESRRGMKWSDERRKRASERMRGIQPEWFASIEDKHRLPLGRASLNRFYKNYLKNAKQRGYTFELDIEYFDTLTRQDCYYCGAHPRYMSRADNGKLDVVDDRNGLDRVDNSIGYIDSNVVPCCKTCNYAKRKMSKSDFENWALRLSANIGNRNVFGLSKYVESIIPLRSDEFPSH